MALPKSLCDREQAKFLETSAGETSVRVSDVSGLLAGIDYDAVSVAYPNGTTEVYTFFSGGLAGTLLATVTLTYVNASKSDLSSAVRT